MSCMNFETNKTLIEIFKMGDGQDKLNAAIVMVL